MQWTADGVTCFNKHNPVARAPGSTVSAAGVTAWCAWLPDIQLLSATIEPMTNLPRQPQTGWGCVSTLRCRLRSTTLRFCESRSIVLEEEESTHCTHVCTRFITQCHAGISSRIAPGAPGRPARPAACVATAP